MIRVNLIDPRREPGGRPAADWIDRAATCCAAVIAVAAVVAVVWGWWSLRRETLELARDVAAADDEMQRLAPVIRAVEEQHRRRDALVRRVAAVEDLHAPRARLVRVLAAVSRRLPGDLWLTALRAEAAVIVVEGRATRLGAVVELARNLEAAGLFARPVEIVDSAVEDHPGAAALIRFEIRASLEAAG